MHANSQYGMVWVCILFYFISSQATLETEVYVLSCALLTVCILVLTSRRLITQEDKFTKMNILMMTIQVIATNIRAEYKMSNIYQVVLCISVDF